MPGRKKNIKAPKKSNYALFGIIFLLLLLIVALYASSRSVSYTPHAQQLPRPTPTGPLTKSDLIVKALSRDETNYRAYICNTGLTGSLSTFVVRFRNNRTGVTYTTSGRTPWRVPDPGICMTAHAPCSQIGSNCRDALGVQAFVDSTNTVRETREGNNTRAQSFSVTACVNYPPADYNGDGVINTVDYAIWLSRNPGVVLCPTPTFVSTPPDLTIRGITRDTNYYRVNYCNIGGSGAGGSAFAISLKNVSTGRMFTTENVFNIPAANSCLWTGGITCGLIDSTCRDTIQVQGIVDANNTVPDFREDNNSYTIGFTSLN